MATKPAPGGSPHKRPRSPHLFTGPMQLHYRFSPAMLASITHRATGSGMATIGMGLLVWFLAAVASGEAAFRRFADTFTTDAGALNVLGWIVAVPLTWALFQHMMSGIRHLVMDTGAAFELKANRTFAVLTFVFSVLLTIAFWLYLGVK